MIRPIDCAVIQNSNDQDLVDLVFSKPGEETITISVSKHQLQMLNQQAQQRILEGQPAIVPINRDALNQGGAYVLEGFQVQKGTGALEGHRRVTLSLRLPDQQNRGVTLPVDFDPENVAYIISEFS